MLILSNVECDARSSHYFSFFFNFVSKRSTEFFFFYRWTRHAISMTCWMMLKRVIVEAKKVKNKCENECWCESAIINKQLKILLRILLTNLYAFDFQTFCCFTIFHLFNTLLFFHSSIRSNNNLWKCFWHDSAFHAS